jgi:hypothetical protein
VGRQRVREQIKAAAKPSLLRGEFVRACSRARARECGRRVPLPFRRGSLQYLAVTNRRLLVFRAPRRRRSLTPDGVLIAKRHDTLALEGMRRSFLGKLKLHISGIGDRGVVLKFRPGDRSAGRELAMFLQGSAVARNASPVQTPGALQVQVRPLAEEIARRLPQEAPWTARPAFGGALRSLGWVEAQLVFLRRWVDEQGMIGADGQPRDAFILYERLERQASTLRADLGLTPLALANVLGSLATVAAAQGDDSGLATLEAEGQRIVTANSALRGGTVD